MKDGKAVRSGKPHEVLTPELLSRVFDIEVLVDAHPITGAPRVTPLAVPRTGEIK
jgi:iron complex transport system ATP-binding protein